MNKYTTLYSRDSKGKIRVWYMEQDGSNYRTVSGLDDGEKVVSEWTVAKPKNVGKVNETTGEEQAASEIENKYKKQKKTGYFENIEDVDKLTYISPMLAHVYKDYKDKIDLTKGEYILQPKLNGGRCIATKNGLFTRKGEKYLSVPHIEETLKPLFNKFPDLVLDGELFNYELRQRLNELMSLVRKTKNITEEDLKLSSQLVEYHIYDGYNIGGLDYNAPYMQRLSYLQMIPETHVTKKWIKVISWEKVLSDEHFNELYQSLINDGQEGAILRKLNSPYEHKRSKNLLKVKPEDDDSGKILNIHRGSGNWARCFKVATLEWNGVQFDATFKGSMEELANLNPNDWIGRQVVFLYNGLTGKGNGKPNFARIDINNCEPST